MFKGILIQKDEKGYRSELKELDEGQLPEGDVTVVVSHSTLNYKKPSTKKFHANQYSFIPLFRYFNVPLLHLSSCD
jgi:hypothetical protein